MMNRSTCEGVVAAVKLAQGRNGTPRILTARTVDDEFGVKLSIGPSKAGGTIRSTGMLQTSHPDVDRVQGLIVPMPSAGVMAARCGDADAYQRHIAAELQPHG